MANKDTRILKSNTLEEFRQKSNEISLHLGDNDQLNVRVADKTFNFTNVSAGRTLFHNGDDASKIIDFEIKPEESLDNTAGYIILKGSPTIPAAFVPDATVTQSGGYSATIVSITAEKILVTNSSGSFNSAQNLAVGSSSILAANIERQIGESYPVGVVRVRVNGTEINQDLLAGGFHVVNLAGRIPLLNSPTVTDFTEGSTVYQGTSLGSATFSGVVLRATSTELLLKTQTGSFNAGTQIKLDGSSSTITGANHGAIVNIDNSFGNAIELNTPAAANDDIKISGPTVIDAVNELQDDIGTTENLNTTATNIVDAINEIESVFDASANKIISSPNFTIDSESDIILDVKGGDVILKDSDIGGTNRFGGFMNLNSGLIISTGPAGTAGIVFDTNGNQIVGGDISLADNFELKFGQSADLKIYHDSQNSYIDELGDGSLIVRSNGLGIINKVATGGTYYDAIQMTAFGVTLHTQGAEKLRTNTTGIQVTGLTDTDTLLASTSATLASASVTDLTNNRIVIVGAGGELEDDANLTFDGTNFTVGSSKFVVAQASGNTSIVGNLDVDGATTLDNTDVDGTLGVSGLSTLGSLTVTGATQLNGGLTMDTDKFTVANGSGNTTIGGTLSVTGNVTVGSLDTVAQDVKGSLNELHTQVGSVTFPGPGGASDNTTTLSAIDPTNLTSALVALDHEIGDTDVYNDGTYGANTIADTLQLLQTGVINNDTNITDLFADVGSLTLSAGLGSDLTSAVNSLSTQVGNNDSDISNLALTIDGTSTVPSSVSLTGLSSTNIKAALNELAAEKLNLNTGGTTGAISRINAGSDSVQDVISRLTLTGDITFKPGSDISGANSTNASTFTFNTGTVLDISNASLLLPGSASNVNIFSTSFLEVDGNVETPMGFSVDRAHVTQTNKSDVRIQWNENHTDGTSAAKPARGWQLQGLSDSGNSNTADIVTFYNAKELFNIESTPSGYNFSSDKGIKAYWDASNQKLSLDVNDPTVQLSGDVTGSATMTNLGNINIATTIQPNSVALGTDTTGNYVTSVSGTQYQIVDNGNTGEVRSVTLGIPNDFRMPGTAKVLSTTNSTSKTTGALTVAGGVGINKDLYVGGDLVVQGDTVTLNTETLTVEDTLVLAGNNLTSEPGSGGFGLEVGPITSPSGVAAGVTGAHSIVYNYGASGGGRWEADGSLILSEATLGSPDVAAGSSSNFELGLSKRLHFNAGTGIGVAAASNGNDIDITISNTLDGYSGWFLSTQGTDRGNIADDERVDFFGGTDLTAAYNTTSTNRVIFNHNNSGVTAGTYGQPGTEDGTYVKSLTVNARGHVTAVTTDDFDDRYDNYGSWTIRDGDTTTYPITSGDTLQITGGAGLTSNFVGDDQLEIKHNDTSSVGNLSSDNSGNTFIQDLALTFDTFGHVTGATVGTGTVSVGNATITLQAQAVDGVHGITMDADNSFTTNQSTNEIITIAHANTSSQSSVNNSGNNVIQDVTLDTYGHVTGLVSKEITSVSGNAGSANTLYVTADNDGPTGNSQNYPLTYINAGGSAHRSFYEDDNLTYNPVTNTLNAGTFNGSIAYSNVTGTPAAPGDGTVTLAGGTALHINETDKNFSMNQTNNQTITIDHDDIGTGEATGTQLTMGFGSAVSLVTDIAVNDQGHVTSYGRRSIKWPSSPAAPGDGMLTIQDDSDYLGVTTTGGNFTANKSDGTVATISLNASSSNTANYIVARNASGYIFVTYLNASGSVPTSVSANTAPAILTGGNGSDNYLRGYNANGVRSFIGTASSTTNGLIKIGFTTNSASRNYAVQLSGGKAYVNVPWVDTNTDTVYTLPTASASTKGGITTNFTTNASARNYKVQMSGTNAYVNVPWTDTNTTYSAGSFMSASAPNIQAKFSALGVGTNASGTTGEIRATNDVTAFYSDDRLKTKLGSIENALDKVNSLSGFIYEPNERAIELGYQKEERVGVSAQEVEAVLPQAVKDAPINTEITEGDNDYKTVQYEKMVPLLIEAIKELTEQNKELRSEIEGLKSINS